MNMPEPLNIAPSSSEWKQGAYIIALFSCQQFVSHLSSYNSTFILQLTPNYFHLSRLVELQSAYKIHPSNWKVLYFCHLLVALVEEPPANWLDGVLV